MSNSEVPLSNEVANHILSDVLTVDADWETRFSLNCIEYRTLKGVLADEQDQQRIAELEVVREESFIRILGAAALSANKQAILAERAEFEAEFGSF